MQEDAGVGEDAVIRPMCHQVKAPGVSHSEAKPLLDRRFPSPNHQLHAG